MKTIILGKGGNQPFKIKNEGVSFHHAQITIDDNGEWMLEDLNSTNGTYIRNDVGDLVRVGKVTISPMTFICLGPDNSKGCCFYAKQAENYGDFREEYDFLTDKVDEYEEKLGKLEVKTQRIKLLVFLVNIVIVIFSMFGEAGVWLLRAGTLVSTGFAAFYDASGLKKKMKAQQEKFYHCPNPLCSHILKASEIREMKCSKCKK